MLYYKHGIYLEKQDNKKDEALQQEIEPVAPSVSRIDSTTSSILVGEPLSKSKSPHQLPTSQSLQATVQVLVISGTKYLLSWNKIPQIDCWISMADLNAKFETRF